MGLKNKTNYIPKVSTFYVEKDIYVNRLESVIFGVKTCILQTRTECKGGAHGIEF